MGGRRLAVNVALSDPATNLPSVFEAGTVPPDWAAAEITNPAAWESDEPSDVTDDVVVLTGSADPADAEPKVVEMPPKAGAGAGTEAWVAYARHLGLEVSDKAPRGDVIEAVEAHLAAQTEQK